MYRISALRLLACTVMLVLMQASITQAAPPPPEYEGRRDPDNPGGERLGEHEGFDGYPADPGEPNDEYYDPGAEYRAYSPNYTGQTFGIGAFGGVGINYGKRFEGTSTGPTFGLFTEATTLLGVVSFYGSLSRTQYGDVSVGAYPDASVSESTVDLTQHELHVTTALHPLLFFIFGTTRFDYTVQNFYTLAGGTFSFFDAEGGDVDSSFFRPGFHLGAGVDTYIDDPNDGGAFWIGVQYKWNNISGGRNDALFRDTWIRDHRVVLRLFYRWNGFIGHGASGPYDN